MNEGSEYCGSCNSNFSYCVEDDVWIATCKTCGRPNVLCDKCHILGLDGDCDGCEHCKKCAVMENEWMKGEIGKVYYVDPALFKTIDCGEEGLYKVVDFDTDGAYVLENVETKYRFSTYGEVIDYSVKNEAENKSASNNEDFLNEFANAVESLLDGTDEEMEHGNYHAPDCIPPEYEEEDDYYGRHDKIVSKVVELRAIVRKMIEEIRNGKHSAK